MPLQDGEYQRLTARAIRQTLESELQSEFGADIDLTQSSVFSTLAETLARVIATNQEQSLEDVYEAAFLETAGGEDLDRVVDILGIQRRPARSATGVQQFDAGAAVSSSRLIQRGTTVRTESNEPEEFETTERIRISLVDSFEGGDLSAYSGDTGSGSVVTDSNAPDGDNALEMDATSGTHIYRDDTTIQRGSTNHVSIKPGSNTSQAATFFVDPNSPVDYYQVVADADVSELRLERVEDGSVVNTIDTTTVSYTAGEWHEIQFRANITGNISATLYDTDDNELASISGDDHTFLEGVCGFRSLDANATKRFDWYTQSKASSNLRAIQGGVAGNVGANSVTVMASPPAGIESTTNLYPVGDSQYEDTDRGNFVVGRDHEGDEQLRERAQDAVTQGGEATHDALVSTLVNDVEDTTSATVFENKTDTDNTGSGGLPPHSFEAVVFGGDSQEVAEAIFETKAVTAHDYGGANGTAVSETVIADSNGQQFTIEFSRPTAVDIDLTLDILVDDTYVGDEDLKDRITRYIGGTTTDEANVVGLDTGVDVVIDQIQDIVVGPDDTGVVGLDQSVDGTPIESTPTSTTVNGLDVIEIAETEVATTDATDASITINKREI